MRLINAQTVRFREFPGDSGEEYAILSHRWEDEEVSYNEWASATNDGQISSSDSIRLKNGFQKIYKFSQLALKTNHQYIWADTCCINKDSSAELQEAINSMFRWYEFATACYAYLEDWDGSVRPSGADKLSASGSALKQAYPLEQIGSFTASKWFSRGWTLQELLAPQLVIFLDRDWNEHGRLDRRKDGSPDCSFDLVSSIAEVTGIEIARLRGRCPKDPLTTMSSAEIISWAARRTTTRAEDRAYCLLGLLQINMPMLYGEADRVFHRLQAELVRSHEDCSLLGWALRPSSPIFTPYGLSPSPDNFSNFASNRANRKDIFYIESPFTITHRGLQMPLYLFEDPNSDTITYAILGFDRGDSDMNASLNDLAAFVLPILYARRRWFRPVIAKDECIRLCDPLWVSRPFGRLRNDRSVCFQKLVPHYFAGSSGALITSQRVRNHYSTTFVYSPQLNPSTGRFHALSLLGSNDFLETYVLLLELTDTHEPSRRFIIFAEFKLTEKSKLEPSPLSVIITQSPTRMTLSEAAVCVHNRRENIALHEVDLPNAHGGSISRTDILSYMTVDSSSWFSDASLS